MNFDFIVDSGLRASLESDHREMERCFEAGAWKAVHVLAGSIVEAVLTDYLVSSGAASDAAASKWTLGQIISESKKAGVLSSRTVDLSSAVKEYRNLIHPGRSVRLGHTADRNGSTVVVSLVAIVTEEVAKQKQETYGYTADQMLSKFERDRSVIPLLKHLVQDAKEVEVRRLLVELMPRRLFELAEDPMADPEVLAHLAGCHRQVLELAPDATKSAVAKEFVKQLREGSSASIALYQQHFFRAADLEHLSGADLAIAKERMLAELRGAIGTPGWRQTFGGLLAHLADKDIKPYVDTLARIIVSGPASKQQTAKQFLHEEYYQNPQERDKKVASRLKQWLESAKTPARAEAAKTLQELISHYEDDLPF